MTGVAGHEHSPVAVSRRRSGADASGRNEHPTGTSEGTEIATPRGDQVEIWLDSYSRRITGLAGQLRQAEELLDELVELGWVRGSTLGGLGATRRRRDGELDSRIGLRTLEPLEGLERVWRGVDL